MAPHSSTLAWKIPWMEEPGRLQSMGVTWDSTAKNTGAGCHFLLQCMKEKSESEVAQSCLTLSDPMDIDSILECLLNPHTFTSGLKVKSIVL